MIRVTWDTRGTCSTILLLHIRSTIWFKICSTSALQCTRIASRQPDNESLPLLCSL